MEEQTEIWLEGIYDSFEVLVAEGNYVECKELIQKVRDEGFEVEAKQLHNELMEESLGSFLIESDPRNIK